MTINVRPYNREQDYDKINIFLQNSYGELGKPYENWLQPRWEYMHYHPYTNANDFHKIGVWEHNKQIVAVANYEHKPGRCYFQVDPKHSYLKDEMITYAENFLTGSENNRKFLKFYPASFDYKYLELLTKRGYQPVEIDKKWCEVTQYDLLKPVPQVKLPNGFKLQSLATENDIYKVDRALWRGFNHEGEPDPADISGRKYLQSAPNFKMALNIVVVAPNGNYVSYSGIWYDSVNEISYIEPVATDPDYRKMGLGKAAVLECLRRTKAMGAKYAIVESGQEFYHAIGFKNLFYKCPWVKYFS